MLGERDRGCYYEASRRDDKNNFIKRPRRLGVRAWGRKKKKRSPAEAGWRGGGIGDHQLKLVAKRKNAG